MEAVVPTIQLSPPPDKVSPTTDLPSQLTFEPEELEAISRGTSLDGMETDTDLGPDLYRVSTTPANLSGKPRTGGAIKLARMGISPSQGPMPRSSNQGKRFGNGFKSLVQSIKGRP
jgi:hypothetical protein